MGKRSVNRLGEVVSRRFNQLRHLSQRGRIPLKTLPQVQILEGRLLLSANIVSVSWDGLQAAAVQGEYITYTTHTDGFEKLATKEEFKNITGLGATGYYQFDSTLSVDQIEQLIKAYPLAAGEIEPNFVGKTDTTTPNDAYFGDEYALQNTGQIEPDDYNDDGTIESFENQAGTVGQDIDATHAWDVTTGSSNVVIADIDTGIDLNQPDLTANIWTNPNPNGQPGFPDDVHGWDFVNDDNDVTDQYGHGTYTAGLIGAAGNNGIGISGVDWHVSILPIKTGDAEGNIVESNVIAAIDYVTMLKSQGVNIVAMNESLSFPTFPVTILYNQATTMAGQAGVLSVVSAGNSDTNLDTIFTEPAKFSVANSSVITVASVDNQGKLSTFSNYGDASVEIAAPGSHVLSTVATYTTTIETSGETTSIDPANPTTVPYAYADGTSASAPIVAGIIGLEAAANPSASPAELKAALLDGARYDPYLASVNGLPAKVATSGVADAYTAVENILNMHVSTSTVREGSWVGAYGSQGEYIVGDSTSFPSFVTADFTGGTPVILQDTSYALPALQKASDPAQRIVAYDASSSSETINLNFTDGAAHQVALYVVDADRKHRSELVQIVNPSNGTILDSQSVTAFTKGQYLVYDLRGNIDITLTNTGGPSAVFSGIFFDPVPTNPNSFQGVNTAVTGPNWRTQYGSQGDYIVGDDNSKTLPTYVSSINSSGLPVVLRAATGAAVGLSKNNDFNHNIVAYLLGASSFDVNVYFTDLIEHQVTLYVADYDHKNRAERIEAISDATGSVMYAEDVSNFSKGEYVTFDVSGDTTFRFINQGGKNAVLSGIFFDATPGESVVFQGINSSSEGDWVSAQYGLTQAYIVGNNFPNVDDLGLTSPSITDITGATERMVSPLSNDPRGLSLDDGLNDRVDAYIESPTTMSFFYTPPDNFVHQIAFYFADYERQHRAEILTITNPTTGQILSQQRVTNFSNGKYFVFDISGAIGVTITSTAYPNAVLSGIFVN